MKALSHSTARLSIPVLGVLLTAVAAKAATPSPSCARWTVGEEHSVFTARGRPYRSIDIAPCGKDFCGVSLDEKGSCGPLLFRFLGRRANGQDTLYGHGRWGTMTKNIQIDTSGGDDASLPAERSLSLYLGDGHSLGDRSENMPRFHAEYRRVGAAVCKAR